MRKFLLAILVAMFASTANADNVVWTDVVTTTGSDHTVVTSVPRAYLDLSSVAGSQTQVVADLANSSGLLRYANVSHKPMPNVVLTVGRMATGFGLAQADDEPLGLPYVSEYYTGPTLDGARLMVEYRDVLVTGRFGTQKQVGSVYYQPNSYATIKGSVFNNSLADNTFECVSISGALLGASFATEYIFGDGQNSWSIGGSPLSVLGLSVLGRYDRYLGEETMSFGLSKQVAQNARASLNFHNYQNSPTDVQLRWAFSY